MYSYVFGRTQSRSYFRFSHTGPSSFKSKTALLQKLSTYKWYHVLPTSIGVSVFLYWSWTFRERDRAKEVRVAKKWEISCYKAIPLRSLSRAFGWVSERRLPEGLRPVLFGAYSRAYGVNLEEMADPFGSYPCMSSFFCRRLKDGTRPLDPQPLVSPADGNLLNSGRLDSFRVEQVKGVTYSIQAFLGDPSWSAGEAQEARSHRSPPGLLTRLDERNNNTLDQCWDDYKKTLVRDPSNELYQCVIYLAPGDYHRFHSPVDWRVKFRRHFEGELFSVKPRMAKWIPDLFSLNERALYVGDWEHGFFSMTAVGATNVGSIRIYKDEALHTNKRFRFKEGREWDLQLETAWAKGEEMGEFRLGSTIVLIFEAPRDFTLDASPGRCVRVGNALGQAERRGLSKR